MPPTMANKDFSLPPAERIRDFLDTTSSHPTYEGWDKSVLKEIKLTDAKAGRTEFEFTITKPMCNAMDILHGGCATTILDVLTSTALLTIGKPGFLDSPSVSRTLTVSFLRAIPVGTRVKVVNEVQQAGRSFTNLTGTIQTLDGKVCVSCVHDKAMLGRTSKL